MDLSRLDSEQTIVALSTPPPPADRPGLRCIVRLSGPDCRRIAAELIGGLSDLGADIPTLAAGDLPGFSAYRCPLSLGPGLRLPIDLYHFRAGHSYTGQEMLELHLPGSAALAGQVVDLLVSAGARPAEPGEFTLRAVLSGRIDLTGAEAVAELIAARGDGQLRAAMQLADGQLARSVKEISNLLLDLLAEVEAGLDFADEPLGFITPQRLRSSVAQARGAIGELLRNAGSVESAGLEHRPTVALIGRPNVGKSTLLNRLTRVDRALCSPLAGTTRDVLAAPLPLPDGEALLLDLAGLTGRSIGNLPQNPSPFEGEGRVRVDLAAKSTLTRPFGPTSPSKGEGNEAVPKSGDDPDDLAQQAARQAVATADLLVIVLDASSAESLAEQLALLNESGIAERLGGAEILGHPGSPGGQGSSIVVCNKSDIANPSLGVGILSVSGLTGAGLDELKAAINARLFASATRAGEQLMLNSRHRKALAEGDAALTRAERLLTAGQGGLGHDSAVADAGDGPADGGELVAGPEDAHLPNADLVAGELRESLTQLGQISGEVMTEDVLGRIFSRFCVGK